MYKSYSEYEPLWCSSLRYQLQRYLVIYTIKLPNNTYSKF